MSSQLPSLLAKQGSSSGNDLLALITRDLYNIHRYISQIAGLISNTENIKGVNPLVNGLDGDQIILDETAQTGNILFNEVRGRPYTVLEAIEKMITYSHLSLDDIYVSDHLEAIRSRIGADMFIDPNKLIPDEDSLSGKLDLIRKDLSQLAADIYSSSTNTGIPLSPSDYVFNQNGLQSDNKSLIKRLIEATYHQIEAIPVTSRDVLSGQTRYAIPGHSQLYSSVVLTTDRFNTPTGQAMPYISTRNIEIKELKVVSVYRATSIASNYCKVEIMKNHVSVGFVNLSYTSLNHLNTNLLTGLSIQLNEGDSLYFKITETTEASEILKISLSAHYR